MPLDTMLEEPNELLWDNGTEWIDVGHGGLVDV